MTAVCPNVRFKYVHIESRLEIRERIVQGGMSYSNRHPD